MFTIEVLKRFSKTFGSWLMATPSRPKKRTTSRPRLEWLEERWCPAGGGPNNDDLVWNPTQGNSATNKMNWYDTTLGQGATQPTTTNPCFLDGNKSNASIEVDGPFSAKSITIRNNYSNTMTIDKGMNVTVDGAVSIQNGSILTLIGSNEGGIVLNNGGTFSVASGATLNLKDPGGNTLGVAFVSQSTDGMQGEYVSNAGTVNWYGIAVPVGNAPFLDDIAPILNTGTINANGGSGGNVNMKGGFLRVNGSDASTNNVGFYQTSGTLNLTNNAYMHCYLGYYQSAGSLTSDATPCTIMTGSAFNGDINIAGGEVIVDTVAGTVSTLTFYASTVEINGYIDVNGLNAGGDSTRCDQLICKDAAVTLGAESYLDVGTTGGGALGTGNRWYLLTYFSISNSWGGWSVPQGMSAPSTGPQNVLVSN